MLQTRRWAMAAAAVVSIGWPGLSPAATLNVPADYPTIQACIDAAASGVDECVVAPGTYNETINFLGKAITLRSSGGADVTTIDATGIGGSVVTCATGEGPNTVLDGLTITKGYSAKGGGIYCEGSSPILRRCIIKGNGGGAFAAGGGVYCQASSPWLDRCVVRDNAVAGHGGGVYCWLNSSPLIENCVIANNRANVGSLGGNGGGIHCFYKGTHPIIRNCVITGNEARYSGGGIYGSSETALQISNCLIADNSSVVQISDAGGGGIYCAGDGTTIRNSVLLRNSTQFEGGGIEAKGRVSISSCIIAGNSTRFLGGGVIFWGRGGDFRNSLIYNNSADEGGGLVTHSASPLIQGCTFALNRAQNGGALHIRNDSQPMLVNSILWGDIAPLGPEIAIAGVEVILGIRFSIVARGADDVYRYANVGLVDWQDGNQKGNPLFADLDGADDIIGTEDDDLRLSPDSPAINAGDPAFIPQPQETDLEGHSRVLCERVDMGAYEFGIGDYDCDQVVNLTDFAAWEHCMTGPSAVELRMANGEERMTADGRSVLGMADLRFENGVACAAFDFDGDGDVDLLDFGGFHRVIGP